MTYLISLSVLYSYRGLRLQVLVRVSLSIHTVRVCILYKYRTRTSTVELLYGSTGIRSTKSEIFDAMRDEIQLLPFVPFVPGSPSFFYLTVS